jgi:DNA-binding NarL/FixJ family response regulator/succinate dehydrogenase/fumarate reductase flavoprotein subunit
MQTIRVLLVDDHAVLRAGLRSLLNAEPDIKVVGEAGDGSEAIKQIGEITPDIVVMDLTMPGMSGLDTIQYISAHFPQTRTLVLTMHAEEQYILRTMKVGASGYVLKSAADVELIQAIRKVHSGETHFSADALGVLLEFHRQNGRSNAEDNPLETLSDREYDVLIMTVQGYASREIGERLFISPKTVDTYRQRLMQKLGLNHRVDLFEFALRHGLLEREDVRERPASNDVAELSYNSQLHAAQDIVWDEEVDVVVVGSGTGQMAALRAVDLGLSVIVLEKSATLGGTMGISGGGIWIPNNFLMREQGIPDSREEALEYLHYLTAGQADPDLITAFIDHCNEAIAFMRQIGIEWEFLPVFNDYYPEFPGGKAHGRTLTPLLPNMDANKGGALVRHMCEHAVARGVRYFLNTPAKRLVVDEDGKVAGVTAEHDQKEFSIRARRGVVLASGGFDHNQSMASNFLRGPLHYTSAVPSNTGDGHLMGMALGAGLRHMNERWGWPVFYDTDHQTAINALANELGRPGAVVVNRKGLRIMNEAGPYDAVTRAFYTFDTGKYEYCNIPSFVLIDSEHRSRYTFASYPPGAELPHWIVKANTLSELARALKIEPVEFEATIEEFNRHAMQGIDPDFQRGESSFDRITAGDPERETLPNICLAPLISPPFYGTPIWPGALGTSGGLQINQHAQVLNVWGNIIPGLYAVGNTAGSPFGGAYPGGGGTLSAGLVFGFLAANHLIQDTSA